MRYYLLLPVFILLLLSGCASTRIYTDNRNTEIRVDDETLGKGEAFIPRTGAPRKAEVRVLYQNQELATQVIRRRFDGATFVGGFFTYGIGWIVFWRFPAEIYIPVGKAGFDKNSIWEQPPGSAPGKWELPPGQPK